MSGEFVEALEGLEYVNLPGSLFHRIAANILGKSGEVEYSGLICNRDRDYYMLLQKLVGYTNTDRAIWRIVAVKKLPQLQAGQLLIHTGCFDKTTNSPAIFAVVKDSSAPTYEVVRAWAADLATEKIREINPDRVACHRLSQ
jgi:hypothetical protein